MKILRSKNIVIFFSLFLFCFVSFAQEFMCSGELSIRGYSIGNKVDTNLFDKLGDLYFPNYLDGWTMDNFDKLPEKYKGLPVAIWKHKTDSDVALTLLNNTVLNITISNIQEKERDSLSGVFFGEFGIKGIQKEYKEFNLLQNYITYWSLLTWEIDSVIIQIGTISMRKPNGKIPTKVFWNLVYSDFKLESIIIDTYCRKGNLCPE